MENRELTEGFQNLYRAIKSEYTRLSVMGRALHPEEEARLDALRSALESLEQAAQVLGVEIGNA